MSIELLPSNFDELVSAAVEVFWRSRAQGSSAQGGTRGAVIAGKNMDGFLEVVRAVASHCGLPEESVFLKGRKTLTLPGHYRPSKCWDALVIHEARLVAAFEFKSQVGSFGNNFNNRSEEAIGTSADLWVAHKHGLYHPKNHIEAQQLFGDDLPADDPRPPFVGYLMLLQDCEESRRPVSIDSLHYNISSAFDGASYADRYKVLCERLMEQNLYGAASLILSDEKKGMVNGSYTSLSGPTSVRNLFLEFAAKAAAAAQR